MTGRLENHRGPPAPPGNSRPVRVRTSHHALTCYRVRMDANHARKHLDDLHGTLMWLRTLTPDNPRYKVWLGDLVEFTRLVFGLDSREMAAIRTALIEPPPSANPGPDPAHMYLARLDRFVAVLKELGASVENLNSPAPDSNAP